MQIWVVVGGKPEINRVVGKRRDRRYTGLRVAGKEEEVQVY